MEYALHEIGLGGCAAIHKYWVQGVQDYALRLDQEDLEMIQEYKSLTVSIYSTLNSENMYNLFLNKHDSYTGRVV